MISRSAVSLVVLAMCAGPHEWTVMTQDGKLMTATEMIRHIEEEHARKQRDLEQALRYAIDVWRMLLLPLLPTYAAAASTTLVMGTTVKRKRRRKHRRSL